MYFMLQTKCLNNKIIFQMILTIITKVILVIAVKMNIVI